MRSSHQSGSWQWPLLVAALSSAIGSLVFWCLYFALYWPYRHHFNEAGRYFDEVSAIVHYQENALLIVPTLALLLLAVLLGVGWWIRRHAGVVDKGRK